MGGRVCLLRVLKSLPAVQGALDRCSVQAMGGMCGMTVFTLGCDVLVHIFHLFPQRFSVSRLRYHRWIRYLLRAASPVLAAFLTQ